MTRQLYPPKYHQALELVAHLFDGHRREVTGTPYLVHLVSVCHIVRQLTDDEDVYLAALLHDVLEDIPSDIYSPEQMEADFGPRVLDIVRYVSHNAEKYGVKESREIYLKQILSGPIETCLVSGADMMHNAIDEIECFDKTPELSKSARGGPKAEVRDWFYAERFKIFRARLGPDHMLIRELEPIMKRFHEVSQQII